MNNILSWTKLFGGAICATITFLFGGFDMVLQILLIMIVLDYITGVMVGAYTKNISSEIGFKGILKKVALLVVVVLSHMLSKSAGVPEIRSIVIGFYIANEGISITENVAKLGVPMPQKLLDILKQLKKDSDDENQSR